MVVHSFNAQQILNVLSLVGVHHISLPYLCSAAVHAILKVILGLYENSSFKWARVVFRCEKQTLETTVN